MVIYPAQGTEDDPSRIVIVNIITPEYYFTLLHMNVLDECVGGA